MLSRRNILIFLVLAVSSFGFVINYNIRSAFSRSQLMELATQAELNQAPLRTHKNEAFKRGEKLTYRMHYGIINAGESVIQVTDENTLVGNRSTYHMVATGISNSAFDLFFPVREKYESYIDEEAVIPWLFMRHVLEGKYTLEQSQIFYHYQNKMDINGKKYEVPDNIQDMTSAFFYARTLDFSNAKDGDIFAFQCFVDDQVWELKIKYAGREIINSDIGKIRCIKFHPVLQQGRVFKHEEDMTAWISDDKNKIAVRAEAKIAVGSVKMDLTEYKGLANPLSLVKK